MNTLDRIIYSTKERVERDKKAGLPDEVGEKRLPFMFERSLRSDDIAFICEVKRASPSKGVITEDFSHIDIACDYEAAGASAISVLTEPEFFQGNDRYLAEIRSVVRIPILRKDFIIDKFQIEQSARLGADAVLLICAILTPKVLSQYIKEADRLGLSCLVEVHDEDELKAAVAAGARVIGVNNRDLRTFEVDTGNSVRLRKFVPENAVCVSESGIRTAEDVDLLRKSGIDAVLVGEALMRSPDRMAALAALRGVKT